MVHQLILLVALAFMALCALDEIVTALEIVVVVFRAVLSAFGYLIGRAFP